MSFHCFGSPAIEFLPPAHSPVLPTPPSHAALRPPRESLVGHADFLRIEFLSGFWAVSRPRIPSFLAGVWV